MVSVSKLSSTISANAGPISNAINDSERTLRIAQFTLLGLQVIIPGFKEIHIGTIIKVDSLIKGAAEIRYALMATFFLKDIKETGEGTLVTRKNWAGNYKAASFLIANLFWPVLQLNSWNMIQLGASARQFGIVCSAGWIGGVSFQLIEASQKTTDVWHDNNLKKAFADFTFTFAQILLIEQTPKGFQAIAGIASGYYGLTWVTPMGTNKT